MNMYEKSMVPIQSHSSAKINATRYLHPRRNRNGSRRLLGQRPLSEFSMSEEEGATPLPAHLVEPTNSTQDLVEFLQTTEPPPSSTNHKKSAFSLFRSGIPLGAKSQANQSRPIVLPEGVTPRTSTNGKRYLHISLPKEDRDNYTSFQASIPTDNYSLNEQYSFPYRPDSLKSDKSSRVPHITLPDTSEKPMSPSCPWVSRKLYLPEVNAVDSYHSYLRTQTGDRPTLLEATRDTNGLKRSLSDEFENSMEGNLLHQQESKADTDYTFYQEQTQCEVQHPRSDDTISDTPTICIYNRDFPLRNSSLRKPRLFLSEAHASIDRPSPLGASSRGSPLALPKAILQKVDRSATPITTVPGDAVRCNATPNVATKGRHKSPRSSIPGPIPLHGTSVRTPPQPGPAPTKALPSLPPGHQSSIGNKIQPIHSPGKTPPPNLSERQSVVTSSSQTEVYSTNGPDRDTPLKRQKSVRRIREEQVRERKLIDVQSLRSLHESSGRDEVPTTKINGTVSDENSIARRRTSHISTITANSSNSADLPRGNSRPSFQPGPTNGIPGIPKAVVVSANSFSPIMVVTEEEPSLTSSTGSSIYSVDGGKEGKITQHSNNSESASHGYSRSPCPSLPSSDAETTKPLVQKDWSLASARTSAGTEGSESFLTIGALSTREIDLDTRLLALEKKNALLESAIIALLQNSARVAARTWPATPTQESNMGFKSIMPENVPPLEVMLQSMGH